MAIVAAVGFSSDDEMVRNKDDKDIISCPASIKF
jgi:hypothetical protein